MGVGKSTVGKKLATKLGYNFVDTDKVFEKKYKINISTFFNKYGEELFRKLENEILLSTSVLHNSVISTGGGLPCFHNGMSAINSMGVSIYLEMNIKAIHNRLSASKQKRPLLQKLNETELINFIEEKLNERIPYYTKADISISALSINIDELVNDIVLFQNKKL